MPYITSQPDKDTPLEWTRYLEQIREPAEQRCPSDCRLRSGCFRRLGGIRLEGGKVTTDKRIF